MELGSEVLDERPALAVALLVVVSAVGFAAVSFVVDGSVRPLEVVVFAVTFAVVYVGFRRYAGL